MDLDPFEELERMAAVAEAQTKDEPSGEEIEKWMELFKYDYSTAEHLLIQHRQSVTREPITDSHWELVREEREAAGYDREAYEHSLSLKDLAKSMSTVIHDKEGKRWTLFRMGGLLESEEKIQEIAGLEEKPKVGFGMGSMGEAKFVWLDSEAAAKFESWLEIRRIDQGKKDVDGKVEEKVD